MRDVRALAPLFFITFFFNITTGVFDGPPPPFYFTNTSGWNTSSSNDLECQRICLALVGWRWCGIGVGHVKFGTRVDRA